MREEKVMMTSSFADSNNDVDINVTLTTSKSDHQQ